VVALEALPVNKRMTYAQIQC